MFLSGIHGHPIIHFYHLHPPVHLLQAATMLTPVLPLSQTCFNVMSSESSSHEPSSHSQTHQPSEQSKASNTTMNMSSKEFNAAWEAHIKTKPWSQFFEARSSQNEVQLQLSYTIFILSAICALFRLFRFRYPDFHLYS